MKNIKIDFTKYSPQQLRDQMEIEIQKCGDSKQAAYNAIAFLNQMFGVQDMQKARDLSKLTRKQITDRRGHVKTVWVRTGQEEKKENKGSQADLFDEYIKNEIDFDKDLKGKIISGWRYGKAPESGYSHNYQSNKKESGVSMAAVGHLNEIGGFATGNLKEKKVKKYYYEGEISGEGGDGEITLKHVKLIDKEDFIKKSNESNQIDLANKIIAHNTQRTLFLLDRGYDIGIKKEQVIENSKKQIKIINPEQLMQKASQLETGTKIEAEHEETVRFINDYFKKHGTPPPAKLIYEHIAKNHIAENKNYYKYLADMEKEMDMQKAKNLTKLIKKQITDKTGRVTTVYVLPEGAKTEWLNKFMNFFSFKSTGEVNQRIEQDYKKLEMDKKGVTWSDWKSHVSEYFSNKDKWDRFFQKKPADKKASAKTEDNKAKKAEKKPQKQTFKLSLMKTIAELYGKASEKKGFEYTEKEKEILKKHEDEMDESQKRVWEGIRNKAKKMYESGEISKEKYDEINTKYGGTPEIEKPVENNFETMPEAVVEPEPVKEEPKQTGEESLGDKFERWKSGDLTGIIGQLFNMTKTMMGRGGAKTFFNEVVITKNENGFVNYADSKDKTAFSGGIMEKSFINDLKNGSMIPVGLEKTVETGNGSKIETVKAYTPEQRKEVNTDAKEASRQGYFNEKPAEILNVGKDVWGAARHRFDTYEQLNADVGAMEKDGTAQAYVTKKNLFGDYGLANKNERVKAGESELKVLASFVVREYLAKMPPDNADDRAKYMDFCRAITRLDQNSQNASSFYFGMADVFSQMFPSGKDVYDNARQVDLISVVKSQKVEEIVGRPLTALFYSLNKQANLSRSVYYDMDKKERRQFDSMSAILLSETGKTNKTYTDIETMIFGAVKLTGIKMKKGDNIVFADNLKDRVYVSKTEFASDQDKANYNRLRQEAQKASADSFYYMRINDKEAGKRFIELNKEYGTNFEKSHELTTYLEKLSSEKNIESTKYRIVTRVYPEEKGQLIKVGKDLIQIAFKFPDGKIRAYEMRPDQIKPENIESISKDVKKKQTRRLNLAVEAKVSRKGGVNYSGMSIPDMQTKLSGDFQFKAIQYGNSMPDAERQYHTQWTLESMSDLSEILGIPLEQITARGKLGLAFGARGSGFQMPGAVAHYEPSTKMINLTRANGYGSLAHEWGHFMDNILSPDMTGYITVNPKFIEKDVTPNTIKIGSIYEVQTRRGKKNVTERYYYDGKNPKYPFAKLNTGQFAPDDKSMHSNFYGFREGKTIKVKEPDNLPFMNKAAEIGQLSRQSLQEQTKKAIENSNSDIVKEMYTEMILNDYHLNNPVECFARAFEAYIADKLEDNGRKNTYLSSKAKTSESDGGLIYPQQEYRKNINKMFDDFFEDIRKGQEMKKAIDKLLKENKNVYIKKLSPITGKPEYRKVK